MGTMKRLRGRIRREGIYPIYPFGFYGCVSFGPVPQC